jgi:hypothetical protein
MGLNDLSILYHVHIFCINFICRNLMELIWKSHVYFIININ